jgi:long-subunit fatty acid transport protein
MNKLTCLLLSSVFVPTLAISGGLERSELPTSFLYEDGNYLEVTYINRNFEITDNMFAPSRSMLDDVSAVNFATKFDAGENLSVGLARYNQAGASHNYQGAGSPIPGFSTVGPRTDLSINALTLMGRYAFDDFSAIGGIKISTVADATADIFKLAGATTAASVTGGSDTGLVAGVAYERPEIALRVELVYEAEASFSLATTGGLLGAATANTTASVPDYRTLNFQSGIAEDTLLYGSIRQADWSNHQVAVAPQTQAAPTSDFSDSTTYTIGIGRKISDEWSVTASYKTEESSENTGTSLLSPTDGYEAIGVAAIYTLANGTEITVGLNYSMLGDKTITTSGVSGLYSDNTVVTSGIKVAYNF